MLFNGRVYSVLIVSASGKFNSALAHHLPEYAYNPITYVDSISAARRAMSECSYDIVIINSPLPDDYGTEFAIEVCNITYSIVLMVVKNEMYDDICLKVFDQGVFTVARPISQQIMTHTLEIMVAARERFRRFEKNAVAQEEKIVEIRLINRAKWKLITENSMTEPDAHAFIGRLAMNRCVTRKQIAQEILDGVNPEVQKAVEQYKKSSL